MSIPSIPKASAPEPELPIIALETFLNLTTLKLMAMEPQNPTVRGLILKQTNLTVPETIETAEAMRAWLCEQLASRVKEQKAKERLIFSVRCAERQHQYGHGNVTRVAQGCDDVIISPEKIVEIAGGSDGIDDFRERLAEAIREASDITCDEVISEEIDNVEIDHGDTETDTFSIDPLTPWVRNALAVLRETNPEAYGELTGYDPADNDPTL